MVGGGLEMDIASASSPPSKFPGQLPPATIVTPHQIWIVGNDDYLVGWHWALARDVRKDTKAISRSILGALGLIKT